jgi:hypothetical protein
VAFAIYDCAIRCPSAPVLRLDVVTLTLKAHVRGGRLILDEPIDLPEGSEVDLVPADDGDSLDDADRARLHEALERALDQVRAGQGVSTRMVD